MVAASSTEMLQVRALQFSLSLSSTEVRNRHNSLSNGYGNVRTHDRLDHFGANISPVHYNTSVNFNSPDNRKNDDE